MAAKTKLNREQTEYLINLIKKQEVLWDHLNYKNEGLKLAAWMTVQSQLKAQFDIELGVAELKTKYSSYRTAYMKELNNEVASKRRGAGNAGVYIPKYEYFNQLNFLRRVHKKRASQINVEQCPESQPQSSKSSSQPQSSESSQPESSESPPQCPESLLVDEQEGLEDMGNPDDTDIMEFQQEQRTPILSLTSRKRKEGSTCSDSSTDKLMEGVSQYLANRTELMNKSSRLEESSTMSWAKVLAADLDSLENNKTKELLKMDIVALVHRARRQELLDS